MSVRVVSLISQPGHRDGTDNDSFMWWPCGNCASPFYGLWIVARRHIYSLRRVLARSFNQKGVQSMHSRCFIIIIIIIIVGRIMKWAAAVWDTMITVYFRAGIKSESYTQLWIDKFDCNIFYQYFVSRALVSCWLPPITSISVSAYRPRHWRRRPQRFCANFTRQRPAPCSYTRAVRTKRIGCANWKLSIVCWGQSMFG